MITAPFSKFCSKNGCDKSHNVDKVITFCKYGTSISFLLDKAGIVDAIRRCVSLDNLSIHSAFIVNDSIVRRSGPIFHYLLRIALISQQPAIKSFIIQNSVDQQTRTKAIVGK